MIKINLLPPEDRGKGADFDEDVGGGLNPFDLRIIIPLVVFLVVGAAIFVMWRGLEGKKADLEEQIITTKAELDKLKAVKSQVEALEKTRTMINDRVREIERLDQNRFYWVRVLDELSFSMPDQLWLTEIENVSLGGSDLSQTLTLRGEAFSNNRIAEFIQLLSESPLVEDSNSIELVSTRIGRTQRTLGGTFELYQFEMRVSIVSPEKLIKLTTEKDDEQI